MKYSYNWLKKISGTKLSPEQLAELLTMRAFEVEGIEKVGGGLDRVVVGEIVEIQKHPNADKLQVVKVAVGPSTNAQGKRLTVVCGAWNIKVGDKVPVALVGAKLPNGMEIKEAEIRGAKSFGMLCAEDELGLGKDHSGILLFDRDAKIGNEVSKELELEDTLIDIDVLANRGHDALSHLGMAREICALEGRNLKYKFAKLPHKKGATISGSKFSLKVDIRDKDLCPRYLGVIMQNIEIKESPMWVKAVLRKLGIKPINNVVDATNYVMLEMGQPMHAFDFDKLAADRRIVVRRARDREKIKLLDEVERELTSEDLVIADGEKAVALAGIMGGFDSGITNETRRIVLEAANFNAGSIRKTRVRLNLGTEASLRFEKELDANLVELAMARVVEIVKWFGGEAAGVVDIYPKKSKAWKIVLDIKYVSGLLGEIITVKQITDILKSQELRIIKHELSKGRITVEIPTFRLDLRTQEDLIEEIGRIYGYEKIKSQAPHAPLQSAKINEERLFERKTKELLTGLGFSEVYNYSFYSRRDAAVFEVESLRHLELQNPMNPEQEWLRASLVPNVLKNVGENLKREKAVHIFEIGKIFRPSGGVLPEEKNILAGAIVLEGKGEKQEKKNKASEFYVAKGKLDALLNRLDIYNHFYADFSPACAPLYHEGRRAEIKVEGVPDAIGCIGEISPVVLLRAGIKKRVVIFEIEMEKLQKVSETEREFAPLRKFPEVERDISLIAGANVRVDDILQVIQAAGGDLVLDVDLFDIFDFADNTSSYSFRLVFGANRTLRSEEVDVLMEKISLALGEELQIKIRK